MEILFQQSLKKILKETFITPLFALKISKWLQKQYKIQRKLYILIKN